MSRYLILCALFLCGLIGCATRQASQHLDRLGWAQEEHGVSLAAVGLVKKNGRMILRSGMRFDGTQAKKITWEDVSVSSHAFSGNVAMRLVNPNEVSDELTNMSSSDKELAKVHLKRAVKVARTFTENMRLLGNRQVELNIFTSPRSDGYMLDIDSDLLNGPIRLVIGNPAPEFIGHHAWWVSALAGAIHELTHVNQNLLLSQDDGLDAAAHMRINREAAAWIAERCAELAFYKSISDERLRGLSDESKNPLRMTWPVLDFTEAFPGLREGRFEPNLDVVKELDPYTSMQGALLGQAVMYLLSDNGKVNLRDDVQNAERNRYCSYILNNTPNFSAGEYKKEL